MKFIFTFDEKFYIYKITNSINTKIYIGRTKQPSYRRRQHVSSAINCYNKKQLTKIQQAIKELGHKNFIFEVFEECGNYAESCEREIYWINFYKSNEDEFGYNEKVSDCGGVILSEDSRKKLSFRMTGNKNHRFGKKISKDIKDNMSKRMLGINNPFYGKTHSDETKKIIGEKSKIRVSGENNPHAKLTLDIVCKIRDDWKTGQYTKIFLSKKYNVTAATIGNIISGKTWK